MNDYAKLYKKRHTIKRKHALLNQIRQIVFSKAPPLIRMAMLVILLSIPAKH